jgi:hypothetical protein
MKLHKIGKLYEQIHNRCFGIPGCEMKPDARKVQRKVVKRAIESEVVIIGQALGKSTQRLSGLSYMSINEQLSRTGQVLDNFLNSFGYTIDPSSSLKYVYSSDIVQCYPGRLTRGDR